MNEVGHEIYCPSSVVKDALQISLYAVVHDCLVLSIRCISSNCTFIVFQSTNSECFRVEISLAALEFTTSSMMCFEGLLVVIISSTPTLSHWVLLVLVSCCEAILSGSFHFL
ncbi:unnamed protein product [Litomosoides sigmodontis]|uniref:Uncharacterized protein n=1 Tax=Litomosoides sigmodontis TaxID=42156 RepID=A0A3P6SKV7_LITSI|nr:unnamed protein product [Litomosoides sigmodontis]